MKRRKGEIRKGEREGKEIKVKERKEERIAQMYVEIKKKNGKEEYGGKDILN